MHKNIFEQCNVDKWRKATLYFFFRACYAKEIALDNIFISTLPTVSKHFIILFHLSSFFLSHYIKLHYITFYFSKLTIQRFISPITSSLIHLLIKSQLDYAKIYSDDGIFLRLGLMGGLNFHASYNFYKLLDQNWF